MIKHKSRWNYLTQTLKTDYATIPAGSPPEAMWRSVNQWLHQEDPMLGEKSQLTVDGLSETPPILALKQE